MHDSTAYDLCISKFDFDCLHIQECKEVNGILVYICETSITLSSKRFLHAVCKKAKNTTQFFVRSMHRKLYSDNIKSHNTVMSMAIKPEGTALIFPPLTLLKSEQHEELQSLLLLCSRCY